MGASVREGRLHAGQTATVADSTLTGNTAFTGGGIEVMGGTLTLNNSLNGPGGPINISAGATLQANGLIQRVITAVGDASTAAITANGNLSIGNFTTPVDFKGTLNIG